MPTPTLLSNASLPSKPEARSLNILVSNDDGIHARGIQALCKALVHAGHHVYLVAPSREQSAMGHALTLHTPLRVDEVPFDYGLKVAYAVSGTPSDCVKLGLTTLITDPIDVVISGINHGPNLAGDVVYSGTVSAALEAAMLHIPAIAVSLLNGHLPHATFIPSAQFVVDNLALLLSLEVPIKTVLNLNTPAVPSLTDFAGLKLCKLGQRMYNDYYERRQDPRGITYYWLAGEMIAKADSADVDVEAIRSNYVTLTPIHADLTDEQTYQRLASRLAY